MFNVPEITTGLAVFNKISSNETNKIFITLMIVSPRIIASLTSVSFPPTSVLIVHKQTLEQVE